MQSQIYILHEKFRANFKIGSTQNFKSRIAGYITGCDYFDSETHQIELYNIIQSKYTCYQLDWIIQQLSTKYSYPFVKCLSNSGGREFYKLDSFDKLGEFFNKLGILFVREQLNIEEFRKSNNITRIEAANAECLDITNFNTQIVSPDELVLLTQLLKLDTNKFILKKFQSDLREEFNGIQTKTRLEHLVISPTGTGKTVSFVLMICDYILENNIKNKNLDIIVITKKKDILTQLPQRIQNYINTFVKSGITKSFEYDIIGCVGDCSTEKLNSKSKSESKSGVSKPQIFIVNWDKLTSSTKTDYLRINWNKFGLVIIDESHWIGANGIYDVMTHIKNKTTSNFVGFSATPVRCSQSNQSRMLDIFGNNDNDKDFNILYEYSYSSALINKDICPIKYQVIEIESADLVTDPDDLADSDDLTDSNDLADQDMQKDLDSNNKNYKKVLSPDSYIKIWKQVYTKIISKTNFKKGIMWFRSRKDLLKYYLVMKSHDLNFTLVPTISISSCENKIISNLIKESGLSDYDFSNSINKFLQIQTNCILLSVYRFTEGADDDRLEFGINMYWSNTFDSDPLTQAQKMGRFNRWVNGDPNGIKQCGYYASLEISNNTESIRKSLINRFRSWIAFARTYSSSSQSGDQKNSILDLIHDQNDKDVKEKEIIELVTMFVDIQTLNFYQIDIKADILANNSTTDFDKYKIKNALVRTNKKKSIQDQINTKSKYNEWAILNDFPVSDELEEFGFNDFKWLFSMDSNDFVSWSELKKLSKQFQQANMGLGLGLSLAKIYDAMIRENPRVPDMSMLNQLYKEYKSLRDIFSVSL